MGGGPATGLHSIYTVDVVEDDLREMLAPGDVFAVFGMLADERFTVFVESRDDGRMLYSPLDVPVLDQVSEYYLSLDFSGIPVVVVDNVGVCLDAEQVFGGAGNYVPVEGSGHGPAYGCLPAVVPPGVGGVVIVFCASSPQALGNEVAAVIALEIHIIGVGVQCIRQGIFYCSVSIISHANSPLCRTSYE